ncbi:hypothetical protein R3W88_011702 [Solanum pinnatisectum]|uniref:Maturase K n=1 Tax=Solanum pinnatisectum TaxID=50273 RepID=A0AAV9L837_9SOLN|nr:hypothetical protein R3W88_011702 [Solanum pinnatisectum]
MWKERYFGSKSSLWERNFHREVRSLPFIERVLGLLNFQGWVDLFLDIKLKVYENKVVEFYVNLNVLKDNIVTSFVNGVELWLILNLVPISWHLETFLSLCLKPLWFLLGEKRVQNRKDMITISNLADCILLDNNNKVPTADLRAIGLVAIILNDIHDARNRITPFLLKFKLFALT